MQIIKITIYELDNGHGKLVIIKEGAVVESEYPNVEEAIDEGYKTMARERYKWKV